MNKFDYINKKNEPLRNAIWKVYNKKCFYCGQMIDMHQLEVDHIIPDKVEELVDNIENIELLTYIDEISKEGFIKDCIINYLPSCGHCNKQKNNKHFTIGNLRYFHEQTRRKANKVIAEIEKRKYRKPNNLECKIKDELIEKEKFDKELYRDKTITDGSKDTYYTFGLGKVRVDSFLPINFENQFSCLIIFKQKGISDCMFSFGAEEIIDLFFDGYRTGINLERKFIWYIKGQDIALRFPFNRFITDRETVDQLCKIMDDLYDEYHKRKSQIVNTVGGRHFEEVDAGTFKLLSLPRYIWFKMYDFAQKHDYYVGDNEWDTFSPLYLPKKNEIRIYKNHMSTIKADVLAELVVRNIDENYVDILWQPGYTNHIYDEMDGFDDVHKWTVEYTHDWVLYKWIPYIFYLEKLDKSNWIKKKVYREPTFDEYKKSFKGKQYNIISCKID